jgi:hypothetical protein
MKPFLATIAGLITGGVMIWALELLGHQLFPPQIKVDPNDLEGLKQLMLNIPVESLVATVIAHIVGVFTGMCVAFVIEKEILIPLYVVGGLFLMSTTLNLTMIPHPTWFNVADLAGVLLVSLLFIGSVKKN